SPRDERRDPRGERRDPPLRLRPDDAGLLGERVRRGALRAAPAARRVRGVGLGAQGRALDLLPRARAARVPALRRAAVALEVRGRARALRARPDVQTDARDAAVRAAAPRLLAA